LTVQPHFVIFEADLDPAGFLVNGQQMFKHLALVDIAEIEDRNAQMFEFEAAQDPEIL